MEIGLYLKYLSIPETMTKLLADSECRDKILDIFGKVDSSQTEKQVAYMGALNPTDRDRPNFIKSDYDLAAQEFIFEIIQQTTTKSFEILNRIKSRKSRDRELEEKYRAEESILLGEKKDGVFHILANSTESLFQTLNKAVTEWVDACEANKKEISKVEDEEEDEEEEVKEGEKSAKEQKLDKLKEEKDALKHHIEHLTSFVKYQTKLFTYMRGYITAFATISSNLVITTISPISLRVIELIRLYAEIRKVKVDEMDMDMETFELEVYLRKNLANSMIDFIGKIAGQLIRYKKAGDKESQEEKANQNLLQSKLFSGGIEDRFITTIFSQESRKHLTQLVDITGDTKIKELLGHHEVMEEDKNFEAIIHDGREAEIDRLI